MVNINKLLSPFVGFSETVDYEIAIYKRHIEKIEAVLAQEIKELEEAFEKSLQNVSSEDEAQYRMEEFCSGEEYWLVKDELPRIQRQSNLIGVHAFLENSLNNLCNRHYRSLQLKDEYEGRKTERKELKDMKGKGLEKAVAYLKDVLGIKFPSESYAWREITSIQKVRNAFTHSEGSINNYDAGEKIHIENYVVRSDYLLFKIDQIIILNGFVTYCLDQFKVFFHELMKLIEETEEKNQESCG